MVAPGNMTRYWVLTGMLVCILYWTFLTSRSTATRSNRATSRSSSTKGQQHSLESTRPRVAMDGDAERELVAEAVEATFQPAQDFPSRFPRIVWQTASEYGKDRYAENADTWKKVQGFQYNFLSDADADEFVHENFQHRPSVVAFWEELDLPVLRADFLRYLLMLGVGGVYSDIDTSCLLHPDRWIPIDLGANTVNAIVGIEYDDHTYQMFVRPISFCQWTLMAKPGHPIFDVAVSRVMSNLQYIARRKHVSLKELTLDKMEVLEATGPGMISDAVIQVLLDQGQNVTWGTFHDQKEPRLFGDVLILPINGFAASQKHSHAGDPAYGDKYVQHHFGRSWYAPERAGTDADKGPDKSDKPGDNTAYNLTDKNAKSGKKATEKSTEKSDKNDKDEKSDKIDEIDNVGNEPEIPADEVRKPAG